MSTQPQQQPRGSNRAHRKPNHHNKQANATTVPPAQPINLSTPPPSPPRPLSEDPSNGNVKTPKDDAQKKKRNNNHRSNKKNRDQQPQSAQPVHTQPQTTTHRHSSSQSHTNGNYSDVTSATPLNKPAYAAPSFHASPAPNALPMPSFFSKSVPEVHSMTTIETEDESSDDASPPPDATPSKPANKPLYERQARESSPADFLFEAARAAKNATRTQSGPAQTPNHSQPRFQPTPSQSRGSSALADDMFQLDLDGRDRSDRGMGPAFSTPYKDRMNALRASQSPGPTSPPLTEEADDRKTKMDVLKNLLFNPQPQRPSSASHLRSPSGPSPGPVLNHPQPRMSPMRTSSGPATPNPTERSVSSPHNRFQANMSNHYPQYRQTSPYQNYPTPQSPTNLRNALPGMHPGQYPGPPPPNYHAQGFSPIRPANAAPYGSPMAPQSPPQYRSGQNQASPAPNAFDVKSAEDQMRQFLKLGPAQGVTTNGVHRGLA